MSRDLGFIPTHEGFLCVTEKAVEEKLSDVANHQLEWGLLYTLTRDQAIIARQEAFEGQLRHLPMWHQKKLRSRCPLTEIPFTTEPTSPWHNKRERTKQRAREQAQPKQSQGEQETAERQQQKQGEQRGRAGTSPQGAPAGSPQKSPQKQQRRDRQNYINFEYTAVMQHRIYTWKVNQLLRLGEVLKVPRLIMAQGEPLHCTRN